MSMNTLLLATVRIVGIISVWDALTNGIVLVTGFLYGVTVYDPAASDSAWNLFNAFVGARTPSYAIDTGPLLSAILYSAMAWVALVRTQWVVSKLCGHAEDDREGVRPSQGILASDLVQAGIVAAVLIGVPITAPMFLHGITDVIQDRLPHSGGLGDPALLISIACLLLQYLALVKSAPMARWLTRTVALPVQASADGVAEGVAQKEPEHDTL